MLKVVKINNLQISIKYVSHAILLAKLALIKILVILVKLVLLKILILIYVKNATLIVLRVKMELLMIFAYHVYHQKSYKELNVLHLVLINNTMIMENVCLVILHVKNVLMLLPVIVVLVVFLRTLKQVFANNVVIIAKNVKMEKQMINVHNVKEHKCY